MKINFAGLVFDKLQQCALPRTELNAGIAPTSVRVRVRVRVRARVRKHAGVRA
jgi:hypothetical protein